MIDRALHNLRVPKAACKLMKFYAARSDGFRPSLKMIQHETGIDAHNVSRCRALLSRYGLLGYDGETISIDWLRVRAFASLEPHLMGKKNSWKISPVAPILLGEPKNDVHTYKGTRDSHLYDLYVATQQAVVEGVKFPELNGKETDNLLGEPKNDVHTYKEPKNLVYGLQGFEKSPAWYNPFDDTVPLWARSVPLLDASGVIVGHISAYPPLPF